MTVVCFLLAVMTHTPPAEDELRVVVDRWIAQLESPVLAERRRAERELLDLGPSILRWLPPRELLPGPASRDAVQRLRIQLQQQAARESARPSRVRLGGAHSLEAFAAEVTRQTGNSLRLAADLPESATSALEWTLENATFWEAVDAMSERWDVAVAPLPERNGLMVTKRTGDRSEKSVCRAGVLRAEVASVSRQSVEGDASRVLVRMEGALAFEPRLRPLFVHFRAGDFTAETKGKPLAAWNPQARYELPTAGGTTVRWDFVAPAEEEVATVSLRGKLLVQLAAATEAIRFDRLTARTEVLRRRGGVTVRLHESRFTEEDDGVRTATVRITVSYDAGGPAFESHRTWVYHNAAWLEDAGRRYPVGDFDALLQTDGSVQLEYRFRNVPAAESLAFVYEAPTLLLDVPFEVEFRDLTVRGREAKVPRP
jgi:hypothetical protein